MTFKIKRIMILYSGVIYNMSLANIYLSFSCGQRLRIHITNFKMKEIKNKKIK